MALKHSKTLKRFQADNCKKSGYQRKKYFDVQEDLKP